MEKPYEDTLAGIPVKPSLLGNNTSDNFHPQLLSACQKLVTSAMEERSVILTEPCPSQFLI